MEVYSCESNDPAFSEWVRRLDMFDMMRMQDDLRLYNAERKKDGLLPLNLGEFMYSEWELVQEGED